MAGGRIKLLLEEALKVAKLAQEYQAGGRLTRSQLTKIAGSKDLSRVMFDNLDEAGWSRLKFDVSDSNEGFNIDKNLNQRRRKTAPRDLAIDLRTHGAAPRDLGTNPIEQIKTKMTPEEALAIEQRARELLKHKLGILGKARDVKTTVPWAPVPLYQEAVSKEGRQRYADMLRIALGSLMSTPRDLYRQAESVSNWAGGGGGPPSVANRLPVIGRFGQAGEAMANQAAQRSKLEGLKRLMIELAAVPPLPVGWTGKGLRGFHGTDMDFMRLAASHPTSGSFSSYIGTHFAKDPEVANTFATFGVHPVELPAEEKILTVPQTTAEGRLIDDDRAVDKLILQKALKHNEKLLNKYKSSGSVPEVYNLSLDERKELIQAAKAQLQSEGYEGLRYTNTVKHETQKAEDPTAYIIFEPHKLRYQTEAVSPPGQSTLSRLLQPWLNR